MSIHPDLYSESTSQSVKNRYRTVIFNNDHTPMDTVIYVLMLATDCDAEEAAIEMWEAHHFGQANVHFASQTECTQAAKVIERAGIRTEVLPEWND